MVFTGDNLLTEDELVFVNELINNFIPDEVPGVKKYEYRRDYYRQMVVLPESISNKILTIIHQHTNRDVTIAGTWINRIDSESNKSDEYHRDDTDISFVFYPQGNFVGGEVECPTDLIAVKPNSYLIMANKIQHRVKPVTNGVRWSIALFCVYKRKTVDLI